MNKDIKNETDTFISNSIDVKMRTAIKPESIPLELKSSDQWLLFKLALVDGKLKKYPFTIRNRMESWNLAENQSSFEIAYRTFTNNPDYSGIGYAITESDPFTCIDFDKVYNPIMEEWNQQALEEIKKFNSYTEFSPSGTGVHVFVIGKMKKAGRRKEQTDGTGREMYSDLHYMTVTGNHLPGTPLEINEAQEIIDELYDKWFPEKMEVSAKRKASVNDFKRFEIPKSLTNDPNNPLKGLRPTKGQVIEYCMSAPNGFGDKFVRLFNGDISGYGSESDADMALAGIIAFHTSDYRIIEEIIHESKLWDKKWERDDYCQRTIMTAIRNRGGI
ncbi:hypothetical protein [Methanosarcina sp.]|uniref:phage NrS-1 polymerase family protein n=1 Tax=Methanosarcina sp. TaxID=2213 RepID=UPI003BB73FCB